MGLSEKIFFRHWPQPRGRVKLSDLTLDLAQGALGEFRLNAPVEILKERLGPPVSWRRWWRYGQWNYPSLGVSFDSSKGMIDGIGLATHGGEHWLFSEPYQLWSGLVHFPDGFKASAAELKVDNFLQHAGEPDRRDSDEEETVLTYANSPNFRDVAFEAEFAPKGELTTLLIWHESGKKLSLAETKREFSQTDRDA